MPNKAEHICVCICTYKRPELLQRLLESLKGQVTGDLFTYSIVVSDNDHERSAEPVVSRFAANSPIPVLYCMEPEQNIPMARNRAVAEAVGDYIAFIDDDEFAANDWLLNLLKACHQYNTDGVVGPVIRHFDEKPPKWILKGKFWQRPTYSTGLIIEGSQGRVNNALLKKEIFAGQQKPFRPEFRAGEDWDFFTRMIEEGHVFIWCNEAVAYEVVPPMRWKRSFILKRSLFLGAFSTLHQKFGAATIVRSIIAIPAYTLILPVSAIMGHHKFMTFLSKLAYHSARLLSCLGIQVIKLPYVTE